MRPEGYQLNRRQLFFAYFMDCQTPGKPGGGPDLTWEMAERAVHGICDLFAARGLQHCLGLCSEPEVMRRQAALFREMQDRGCWLALHFQARAYQPPGGEELPWDKPLAAYDYDEQYELLRIATDDWEQSCGQKAVTFSACCAQANDFTHPLIAALGYRQCYTSVPGRYFPEAHQRWWGAYPHSRHCSSKSRLIPGELDLYEVPHTHELTPRPGPVPGTWAVNDCRAEHELSYEDTRAMAVASLEDMLRRDHPLLYLLVPTHNTWDVADATSGRRRALETAIDVAYAVADQFGLELTPASLPEFHAEADRLNAF